MTIGIDLGTPELRDPVTISALEFDVLWEHLRLESMPLVLKVPSPGRTTEERATFEQRAWTSLAGRGLGSPRSVDENLEELLSVLDRPDVEVDARLWLGRSTRVLAAAKGPVAVLATLTEDTLTLRPASAEGLPREALTALPSLPAGKGRSITLPSPILDAAAAEATTPASLEPLLVAAGVRGSDARTLTEMLTDAGHRGQFGAAHRDKWGKRHRNPEVVSFFDNPTGRYLQLRRQADPQPPWSTISPTTHRDLLAHLTALLPE
ncbi:ESX secretion-associated protein EspG [Actinosynnema sp. NPDC020468]|uniref:ESX secretion-associated protein EspG n=1 Tax=Actinosynnema sp. NPDC020468 TaxID=3154488 RepID=UPI00340A8D4E